MLIALLPQGPKRALYKAFFGYSISPSSRIGVAYLDCSALTVRDGARISHGVAFVKAGAVTIGMHAKVGMLNLFRGGNRIDLGDYCQVIRLNVINAIPETDRAKPNADFMLGFGSVITAEHRIDFTDGVAIGRCSILAGRNSSIWTHNRRAGKRVQIGEFCYVGSEIRMAPGARIPDCSVVAIGAVISGEIPETYSLIGGVPARRLRALKESELDLAFSKTRLDIPDDIYPLPEASNPDPPEARGG